jgi:transcription antitermination factor NusG
MQTLRGMVSLEQDVEIDNCLTNGQRVRVIHGPLMGFKGILAEKKGKSRFGIQIGALKQSLYVNVDVKSIVKI